MDFTALKGTIVKLWSDLVKSTAFKQTRINLKGELNTATLSEDLDQMYNRLHVRVVMTFKAIIDFRNRKRNKSSQIYK